MYSVCLIGTICGKPVRKQSYVLQLTLAVQSLLYKSKLSVRRELSDWRRALLHTRDPWEEPFSLLEWAPQHGSSLLLLTFPVALSAETNSDGTRASRSHFHHRKLSVWNELPEETTVSRVGGRERLYLTH